MPAWRPWPYAATAIVQYGWSPNTLRLWVTFRHPMDQTVKPANAKWLLDYNGVPGFATTSTWLDEFTLLLTRIFVFAVPDIVYLSYLGPDPSLRTTWGKQWEPWEEILAYRAMGSPYSGTKTHAVVGPTDNLDVTDIGILFLDCSANNVIIGGFVGGINGQHLDIARLCAAANDATLEHNEAHAFQKIFLHKGLDETLTGEYGGWNLVCNGTSWYDTSHSKHV